MAIDGFETVVQFEIYQVLTNDPDIQIAGIPVYDDVPQPDSGSNAGDFPYIVIGDDAFTQEDTDTENMMNVTATIQVWSRERGRGEMKKILGFIYAALHRVEILNPDYKFINVMNIGSDSFLEADGLTRRGVTQFLILIEEF